MAYRPIFRSILFKNLSIKKAPSLIQAFPAFEVIIDFKHSFVNESGLRRFMKYVLNLMRQPFMLLFFGT
jgi:hypothetical protein